MSLRVAVVGSGGREHALRHVLSRTATVVAAEDDADLYVIGRALSDGTRGIELLDVLRHAAPGRWLRCPADARGEASAGTPSFEPAACNPHRRQRWRDHGEERDEGGDVGDEGHRKRRVSEMR